MMDWVPVIHLAEKWALDDLRKHAIAACTLLFTSANAAEQLWAARSLGIKDWMFPAVKHLVTRDAALSEADIDLLGSRLVALVLAVRERNLAHLMKIIDHSRRRERGIMVLGNDAWIDVETFSM
jgi:hypothetical protein